MPFFPIKSSLTLLSFALLSAAPAWSAPVVANQFVNDAVLPPIETWQGASEALMLARDSKWATPFEQSGGLKSPDYEATMAWLDKLVKRSKYLSKVSLGKIGRAHV